MESREKEWLAEYRRGDVQALGRLVDLFRRPLFGFILRMTEGREDAEEIFQEVWLRAVRNLDGFREKSLISWLFRIAHNLIIDRARKMKSTPEADLVESHDEGRRESPISLAAARGIGPDEETEGRDLGIRIAGAVEKLSPEQKEVFVMRMEGVSFKEIASIQNVSINTALGRMQYALKKLREELKTEYDELIGMRP